MAGLVWRIPTSWEGAWNIDRFFWPGDALKNVAMALVATAVHRAFPDLLDRSRSASDRESIPTP
jgi:biotin transport system substrate-specific component